MIVYGTYGKGIVIRLLIKTRYMSCFHIFTIKNVIKVLTSAINMVFLLSAVISVIIIIISASH